MTDRDVDAPDAGPDERDQTMAHSPTRIAAAALLGATATCLVAGPVPAEAAQPVKNHTYTDVVTDPVYGVTAHVTIRIGKKVDRVKKVTVVLSCADGSRTLTHKDLKIDSDGFIKTRPGTQVDGHWLTKHKVLGGAQGHPDQPCGGYYMQYVAKD
jgi:hypothetical protein